MEPIEKVDKYLTDAKVFFLATEDGDQPKVRPLGYHQLEEGKIYFSLGDFKEVYKQILKNPKVEIVANIGGKFLRYYGIATFEEKPELAKAALDAFPILKKVYNEETGNKLELFYLKNATAEFRNMMEIEESYTF
jgi:uncharacterized pyridoxamine 5'-phosphate oxidase family protein